MMVATFVKRPTSPLSFEPLIPSPTEILCDGSDEEATPEEHRDKRRRVETQGQIYLEDRPLFIQSAALRGPFEEGWVNPWGSKTLNHRASKKMGFRGKHTTVAESMREISMAVHRHSAETNLSASTSNPSKAQSPATKSGNDAMEDVDPPTLSRIIQVVSSVSHDLSNLFGPKRSENPRPLDSTTIQPKSWLKLEKSIKLNRSREAPKSPSPSPAPKTSHHTQLALPEWNRQQVKTSTSRVTTASAYIASKQGDSAPSFESINSCSTSIELGKISKPEEDVLKHEKRQLPRSLAIGRSVPDPNGVSGPNCHEGKKDNQITIVDAAVHALNPEAAPLPGARVPRAVVETSGPNNTAVHNGRLESRQALQAGALQPSHKSFKAENAETKTAEAMPSQEILQKSGDVNISNFHNEAVHSTTPSTNLSEFQYHFAEKSLPPTKASFDERLDAEIKEAKAKAIKRLSFTASGNVKPSQSTKPTRAIPKPQQRSSPSLSRRSESRQKDVSSAPIQAENEVKSSTSVPVDGFSLHGSDVQPDAQIVSADPGLAVLALSGPSTNQIETDKLFVEEEGDSFIHMSTQAALLKVQQSFQNELISPPSKFQQPQRVAAKKQSQQR